METTGGNIAPATSQGPLPAYDAELFELPHGWGQRGATLSFGLKVAAMTARLLCKYLRDDSQWQPVAV
jgi:hypothetical protein